MNQKPANFKKLYSKDERDRSAHLVTLSDSAGVGLWDWDWNTGEVYFSPEWKRQLGYADHELPNAYDEWESRLHPDDLAATRKAVSDFCEGRRPVYDVEFRLRHRDGSWRWIFARAQFVRDDDGRPVRMMGCHLDVTDRKHAEAALLVSEERLKYAVEATQDGLWDWDITTGFVYYSPQWARLLGYASEEVPQRVEFFFSVLHPADVDGVQRILDDHLQGRAPDKQLEIRLRTKSGGYGWFLDRGRVVVRDNAGRPLRMVGTITDISERKRTESLLDLQKELLEGIASGLSLAESLADLARRIEAHADGALCSILLADASRKHLHHGAAPSLPDVYCSAIDGIAIGPDAGSCGTASYRLEQVIVADIAIDPLWAKFRDVALPHGLRACWSTPILNAQGQLLGTFAVYYREPRVPSAEHQQILRIATSIAAVAINKHLADADRRVGERAMQAISQGVLIVGSGGEILSANPAWTAMTGYGNEELVGSNCDVLKHSIVDPHVASNFARTWDNGADFAAVVLCSRRDGTHFWNDLTVKPARDDDGKLTNYIVVSRDVTERMLVEVKVREAAQRLEIALEKSGISVWDCNLETGRIWLDATWATFLGGAPAETTTTPAALLEMVHPDDRDFIRTEARRATKHGSGYAVEHRVRTESGDWKWILSRGRVILKDDSGRSLRMAGTNTDITERKRIEEALKASEAQFRATFEEAAVGIVHTTIDGKYLRVNQKFCDMVGYDASELVGCSAMDITHVDDRDFGDKSRLLLWRGEMSHISGEKRYIRNDGTVMYANRTVSLARDEAGNPLYFIRVIEDITARKEAEERYRATFDNAPVGILHTALDGYRILHANRKMCDMLGYTPDELLGMTSTDIVHQDYRFKDGPSYISQLLDGQIPSFASERKMVRKDGSVFWVNRTVALARNTEGDPIHFIRIVEDISKRKAVEEASAQLAAIVDYSNDAIISRSTDLTILTWNASAERLFGYAAHEAIGQKITLILPPDRQDELAGNIAKLARYEPIPPYDTVRVTKDGRHIDVSASLSPILDTQGSLAGVSLIFRDISARKQAEAERAALETQLRESQKLEAIGTLAGGVAHDFNNIIAVILGNAELARISMTGEHAELMDCIEEIRKAGTRARSLVQQILSFSRKRPPERKRVALAPVVHESVRLLKATLPARLSLGAYCDPGLPEVLVDPNQIQQVLINLVTNAMQAIQSGAGSIRIRVDSILLDRVAIANVPQLAVMFAGAPRRLVRLCVEDNGPGMDEVTKSRIFEPFFTTKPPDKGTGLGLSVVHGIVRAHDGVIVVSSRPGEGSVFTIYLPVASDSACESSEIGTQHGVAQERPGASILYLDDEQAMADFVKKFLERRGHQVSAFLSHDEAIGALRRNPSGFDLLITDYNMPGKSGLEVVREALLISPRLMCAVTSGYVDEHLRTMSKQAGVAVLVNKENLVDDIGDVVQRLLSAVPGR